jgi:topoisomerase-4 subunit B
LVTERRGFGSTIGFDPRRRTLLQVKVVEADRKTTDKSVEWLMDSKPELRFEFIQERAEFADEAALDV